MEFTRGFRALLEGYALIVRPGLKRYAFMPLAINLVLFGALIVFGADQYARLVHHLEQALPDWLAWLAWLGWIVFAAAASLVVFYGFTLIANLIGAPFNGLLSAHVDRQLGRPTPVEGGGFFAEIPAELVKLAYQLGWGLVIGVVGFALLFVPPINAFVPLLWFIGGAWLLAVEYADYPLSNHGVRFRAQRQLLRLHLGRTLGFGAATTLATMVPILNLLVMPAAVAGATWLWRDIQSASHEPTDSR